jgi:nitrous oxidase accessory protein NosD
MKTTLSLALSLFICTTAYSQNTWIVDQSGAGDFTEIQLAIDSLSVVDGDEVIVKDGTYFEHINFNQKEILLRSENGAATTIIDGGGSGDVVSIINGEQAPTELRGFTVTNGGRGVHCYNYTNALINECTISNNLLGGVRISENCDVQMDSTTITGNTNAADFGSGIHLSLSNMRISNSVIAYNSADNQATSLGACRGGGIYAVASSLVIDTTEFTGNSAYTNTSK